MKRVFPVVSSVLCLIIFCPNFIMVARCSACQVEFSVEKDISCDLCRQLVHAACAGISRTEAQCLKSKERKISYHCPSCADFKDQLKHLKTLTSVVDSMQKELETIKQRMSAGSAGDRMDAMDVERVIGEVVEREKRGNNIILFGMPELEGGTKNDQLEADGQMVAEIFRVLEVPSDDVVPVRLGKFDASKHDRKRPVKVTLSDSASVIKVLRVAKKLKSSEQFRGVVLSKDKTPYQQQIYRGVRSELLQRKAAGEANIFIKYANDVPFIAKSDARLN